MYKLIFHTENRITTTNHLHWSFFLSTGSSPDSSAWSQDFQNEALTLISGFLLCYFSDFFPITLFFSSPTTSYTCKPLHMQFFLPREHFHPLLENLSSSFFLKNFKILLSYVYNYFSQFTQFCNHHHHSVLEYYYPPNKISHVHL